jgi:hypothetical protein
VNTFDPEAPKRGGPENPDPQPTRAEMILDCISDTVGRLLFYDRKGDEELPLGEIEKAIASGEISVDAIVATFRSELEKGLRSD